MAVYFPWMTLASISAVCKYGIAYGRDVKMLSLYMLLLGCGALTVNYAEFFEWPSNIQIL